jgi:hypothetical protein
LHYVEILMNIQKNDFSYTNLRFVTKCKLIKIMTEICSEIKVAVHSVKETFCIDKYSNILISKLAVLVKACSVHMQVMS